MLKTFWHEEAGQDMIEYTLLLGFVALAVGAILTTLTTDITATWTKASTQVKAAST